MAEKKRCKQHFVQSKESRSIEGQALANVLLQQTAELKQNIAGLTNFVEIYEQEFQTRYQEKLEAFLGAEVERDRLLTEIAILFRAWRYP